MAPKSPMVNDDTDGATNVNNSSNEMFVPSSQTYLVQMVAPSGNNSTTLLSSVSQQVFSSMMPSSVASGGYTNFAPLMGSVGVPSAHVSPQVVTPAAPASTSFSPQATAAFVPNSAKSVSVIPGETVWVITIVPLVTQNTGDINNLVSYDTISVPNIQMPQLSSQQRTGLVEAVHATENNKGLCSEDVSTQVNARGFSRAVVECVQSGGELAGGSLVREAGLSSGCHEQGVVLDMVFKSEDAMLPIEASEFINEVDQENAEACELTNEVNEGVHSKEFLRSSRGVTVSEVVSESGSKSSRRQLQGNVRVYKLNVYRLIVNTVRHDVMYRWLANEGLGITA
ncbi:hypothetical protein V6N11_067723 [Hibiscus sabdariffa]|uniref:Uncharacterized protein n=1 Tax=Hibiscus sabdariffa TaxID=183260 RepID=A0ABR2SRZ4_9ROSI